MESAPGKGNALHIVVTGHVQGVGFRGWTASQARRAGISGWVRNCPDGSVEIHAEGPAGPLRDFVSLLESGPSYSRVEEVEAVPVPGRGYKDFSIDY